MAGKRTIKKNACGNRSAALALIAMLELLLLCISLTFSWFEPAVDPILEGKDISTAPALLSTVNMAVDGVAVLNKHFDYSALMDGSTPDESLSDINKTKFSPLTSHDGIHFISPNGLDLNHSEIQSAALSFQFTIKSAVACDFWFKCLPVMIVNGATRGISQAPTFEDDFTEDQSDWEDTSNSEIETSESGETTGEDVATTPTETEELTTDAIPEVTEEHTEDVSSEGEETQVESTESVQDDEPQEEKPSTRNQSSCYDAFYISFHGEDCDCNGQLGSNCVAMRLSEAGSYLANNGENNRLFSHVPNGDNKTVMTCSIWYQPTETNELPVGAEVGIIVEIASNWGQTKTIQLTDETTTLSELYPQMIMEGYYVEVVDTATEMVYPAVFDGESGMWYAEIPASVVEFDVRYRSKGVDRDILATWEGIHGLDVRSFELYDEGVFLSTE